MSSLFFQLTLCLWGCLISVDFRVLSNSSDMLWLDYVMAVNDAATYDYHRPNNFTRLHFYNDSAMPKYVRDQLLIVTPARLALVDLVNSVRGLDAPTCTSLVVHLTRCAASSHCRVSCAKSTKFRPWPPASACLR